MGRMTDEDYQEQIRILDKRIDKLTAPIPSRGMLLAAESIRHATTSARGSEATYSAEDYHNLVTAVSYISEHMPRILEDIRARSIDPETGWRFVAVTKGNGDNGLCAICREPFQHFEATVQVHYLGLTPGRFEGVCRECVRNYGPEEFGDDENLIDWLQQNGDICEKVESDNQTEDLRIGFIDAIRRYADSTHYFRRIMDNASKWADGAFGEWR